MFREPRSAADWHLVLLKIATHKKIIYNKREYGTGRGSIGVLKSDFAANKLVAYPKSRQYVENVVKEIMHPDLDAEWDPVDYAGIIPPELFLLRFDGGYRCTMQNILKWTKSKIQLHNVPATDDNLMHLIVHYMAIHGTHYYTPDKSFAWKAEIGPGYITESTKCKMAYQIRKNAGKTRTALQNFHHIHRPMPTRGGMVWSFINRISENPLRDIYFRHLGKEIMT